jgi:hypothetical protein
MALSVSFHGQRICQSMGAIALDKLPAICASSREDSSDVGLVTDLGHLRTFTRLRKGDGGASDGLDLLIDFASSVSGMIV